MTADTTAPLSDAEIAAIRARLGYATAGPWRRLPPTKRGGFTFGENQIVSDGVLKDGGLATVVVAWTGFNAADGTKAQKRANARCIAHMPKDVLALLREVDRLRAYVARVEATLPMVDDLIGSAPDITGSRSTEDYMRVLRGPGPEPLPAEPSETLVQAVANAICAERHASDQARAAIAAFQKAVQGD